MISLFTKLRLCQLWLELDCVCFCEWSMELILDCQYTLFKLIGCEILWSSHWSLMAQVTCRMQTATVKNPGVHVHVHTCINACILVYVYVHCVCWLMHVHSLRKPCIQALHVHQAFLHPTVLGSRPSLTCVYTCTSNPLWIQALHPCLVASRPSYIQPSLDPGLWSITFSEVKGHSHRMACDYTLTMYNTRVHLSI